MPLGTLQWQTLYQMQGGSMKIKFETSLNNTNLGFWSDVSCLDFLIATADSSHFCCTANTSWIVIQMLSAWYQCSW